MRNPMLRRGMWRLSSFVRLGRLGREKSRSNLRWDAEATQSTSVSIEDGEKFLQEYMQNMGWKTKSRINETPRTKSSEGSDSEDEEFLEKVDEFETKYNFRFEEEGGHAISSHSRQVEDSVRVKDKKRKRERDQKKDRKEEDRKKKLIELQHLKNKKREEINRRLAEIEKVTGNKTSAENVGSVLETEFDPTTYDEEMNQLLGSDYYEQADGELDLPEDNYEQEDGEIDVPDEGGDYNGEGEEQESPPEDNMWYYCDSCIRPIRPGNIGYECKDCEEETTLCHNCKSGGNNHASSHKLKKFKVADDEEPPENWQEVLYQMKKKRSKEIASGKMDEIYGMEFEDVIGGDVACRFKYAKVDSDSFGLSPEAILVGSDKELNRKVSLKKLHPYRKAHAFKRVKYHDGQRRSEI